MNKQNKIIIGIVVIIIAIFIFLVGFKVLGKKIPNNISISYDNFAQCLTEKGAVMYGAEWCAHCQEQKAIFGNSFKFIKYVECSDNIQICIDRGIQIYPTWLIGTSTKIEGSDKNKIIKELSEITGCEK
ncbi:MAG: hypothetical protein V1910_01265 [bacterium]